MKPLEHKMHFLYWKYELTSVNRHFTFEKKKKVHSANTSVMFRWKWSASAQHTRTRSSRGIRPSGCSASHSYIPTVLWSMVYWVLALPVNSTWIRTDSSPVDSKSTGPTCFSPLVKARTSSAALKRPTESAASQPLMANVTSPSQEPQFPVMMFWRPNLLLWRTVFLVVLHKWDISWYADVCTQATSVLLLLCLFTFQ